MKLIFVIYVVHLLSGIEGVGRGRTKYRGKQLAFPGQPDVSDNTSVHDEVHNVAISHNDAVLSKDKDLEDAVIIGEGDAPSSESPNEARQFYPGWLTEDNAAVTEYPQLISSYQPQHDYPQQPEETTQQSQFPPAYQSPPSYQPQAPPSYQPQIPPSYQPQIPPSYQPQAPPSYQPQAPPSYQPPQQPQAPPSYQPPQQPQAPPSYQPPQQPQAPPSYQPPQQPQAPPSYQPPQQPQAPPSNQPQSPPSNQPPQQPQSPPSNQRPSRPNPPQSPTSEPISPPGCLAARGQFPSQKNCANYLNCWDDVVIEQQCPNELLFNEVTGLCDFDYNVNCGNRPGATPKPALALGSKRCPDPNGRYRSAKNCSEFYVCLAGSPIKFSCPRGLVYNDDYGVCDYLYNVDCQGTATPKPEPLPRPEPPLVPFPQQPQIPHQTQRPAQRPQPTFPPSAYPPNPWRSGQSETDPWHQRPVGSQLEVDNMKDETGSETTEEAPTEPSTIVNPWNLMPSVPTELTKVPCENGTVHRLHESCSSVVVCRDKRPHLVQCSQGHTYDRPTDSCRHFTVAKC